MKGFSVVTGLTVHPKAPPVCPLAPSVLCLTLQTPTASQWWGLSRSLLSSLVTLPQLHLPSPPSFLIKKARFIASCILFCVHCNKHGTVIKAQRKAMIQTDPIRCKFCIRSAKPPKRPQIYSKFHFWAFHPPLQLSPFLFVSKLFPHYNVSAVIILITPSLS